MAGAVTPHRAALISRLAAELAGELREDARAYAEAIAGDHGDSVAAVLFYGSCLRGDARGILDLYVLVDSYRDFSRRSLPAAANRLLPPNVAYRAANAPINMGAKVAVISRAQFRARLAPGSLDTTLWARFCQPARLAYCRDEGIRRWVAETIAEAAVTAGHWALRLGPETGTAEDYWLALFRSTYATELRVEGADRAATLYGHAAEHYAALLPLAISPAEATVDAEGILHRHLNADALTAAARSWNRRRRTGKALNVARLAKALFTFEGGVDYILWKLERHSGQKIALTPWQRRHPLLAAPGLLVSLRRRGIIR